MPVSRISFSYPKELKERLEELSEVESRSLSSMIQVLLKEGLERRSINKTKKGDEIEINTGKLDKKTFKILRKSN